MGKLMNEEQVKEALAIKDWRNVSKKKIMEFTSILSEVDNDVAMKIIDQIPAFFSYGKDIVATLKNEFMATIESNEKSGQRQIEAFNKIIDVLGSLAEKDGLSFKEKKYFVEQMMKMADIIDAKDSENKEFLKDALEKVLDATKEIALPLLFCAATIFVYKYFEDRE